MRAKWMWMIVVLATLPATLPVRGQALPPRTFFPRNSVTLGLGAGVPGRDLKPYFETSFALKVEYGYRFTRNFQFDAGFDSTFGAARVNDFLPTDFGDRRIRDFQYFVPFGGRVILPLARERAQFYAGGGGAYVRYQERVSQPSDYFNISCPPCRARDGFGYYAQAGFRYYLDSYKRFSIGGSTRVYRVETDGPAFGSLPPIKTSDRWVNAYLEFGISF